MFCLPGTEWLPDSFCLLGGHWSVLFVFFVQGGPWPGCCVSLVLSANGNFFSPLVHDCHWLVFDTSQYQCTSYKVVTGHTLWCYVGKGRFSLSLVLGCHWPVSVFWLQWDHWPVFNPLDTKWPLASVLSPSYRVITYQCFVPLIQYDHWWAFHFIFGTKWPLAHVLSPRYKVATCQCFVS